MNLFPLAHFDVISNSEADRMLEAWGHWLGPCNRPFGRQSFGLFIEQELLAVAASATTPNARCGGFDRKSVVELARLCSHPDHRDLTRITLRLWRKIAPALWTQRYWPVVACVSYCNASRHTGDIYRFDGWKKVMDVRGGRAGVNTGWTRPRKDYEAKSVWVYELSGAVRQGAEAAC